MNELDLNELDLKVFKERDDEGQTYFVVRARMLNNHGYVLTLRSEFINIPECLMKWTSTFLPPTINSLIAYTIMTRLVDMGLTETEG